MTAGPAPSLAVGAVLPLAPHVRRRWRQRLGLAPDLVVETGELAPDDVETALAVAAAAVVTAPHLSLALALGCPTVTDAAAAAALGARDGDHLVVGGRDAAVALAADPIRAARMSHRGRARAEEAFLPTPGAPASTSVPSGGVAAALDELGTAPSAPVRDRVAAALDVFGPLASDLAVAPSVRHPSIDDGAVVRLGGRDPRPAPPGASGAGRLRRGLGRVRRAGRRILR